MPWAEDEEGAERLSRLAPAIAGAIADETVTGCWVNPQDGILRLNTWDRGHVATPERVDPATLEAWINAVASGKGVEFGPHAPRLAANLPDAEPWYGARLQAQGPPITTGPAVVLRKRPRLAPRLSAYVDKGLMSAAHCDAFGRLIADRVTGVIAGGTNSGKTTLLGAGVRHIAETCPEDRIVTIEDTPELHCPAPDVLALFTAPYVTPPIDTVDLLKDTLRLEPKRIIVGEVRDKAAYTFLDASATGHPGGLCSTHAETALGTLQRLDRLAQFATGNIPVPQLVAESVGFVIVIKGDNQTRRVVELVRVAGYTAAAGYTLHPL